MSSRGETIRLATRGSDLALRQATTVAERLEGRRHEVELVEVETRGDRVRDELIHRLGKTGAFVRSLDEQVLAGEVDAAVHSMKDVPTEGLDDLVVAAVPERATPGDLLVTPDDSSLEELPDGATVGTSSLRRRAQLLGRRPDLDVRPLRGNVDTRVEKLLAPHRQREHQRRLEAADAAGETEAAGGDEETDADEAAGADGAAEGDAGGGDAEGTDAEAETAESGEEPPEFDETPGEWFDGLAEVERRALGREVDVEYDAIVLAAAGLERTGLRGRVPTAELPTDAFVPAPGQGALAVTAREGELATAIHDAADHPRSRVETTVERSILAELGGGCVAPIGAYAVLAGEYVDVAVQVADRAGEEVLETRRDLPVERHAAAARELARELREDGAAELVEQARRETGADAEPERREDEHERSGEDEEG